ncbi:hypothetical protein ABCR94_15900 [Streptomyces sp. 21So2-11]|uniref:hypothetical protein n=1 Tax=Streptomyces sp. 21So2-11 TaxID=3144408 RepID=UPI00321A3EEA
MSGLIAASSMLSNDCVEAVAPWLSAQADRSAPEGDVPTPGAEERGERAPSQGDTGLGAYQVQRSLLQVPQFHAAEADGGYDIEVRAAVARFQD